MIKLLDLLKETSDKSYIRDMSSFGLSKDAIDSEGYVTLFHGGKKLPSKLRKGEILFLTPYENEAKDYANMRKGKVFTLKVKPELVNWNQGSYEVEYEGGGTIENGYIIPPESKASRRTTKSSVKYDDPFVNDKSRYISYYKSAKVGQILPKSNRKVLSIVQHRSGEVQFEIDKQGSWFNADRVLEYEYGI